MGFRLITHYGDVSSNGDSEIVGRELQISFCGRDWSKFENQPFYPELMKFLETQGNKDSN